MLSKLIYEHKHSFAGIVNDVVKDRSNIIKTLSDYETKIINISNKYEDAEANKVKGDMFEVLSKIFFDSFALSPHVGISNYEMITLSDDYGVDAIGENAAGTKAAVQVKFRSNPKNLVTYTDLSKTFTYSIVRGWSEPNEANSIWLFTNSFGVTPACTTVLGNRLKIINRDIIEHYLDNNKKFWEMFIKKLYKILKGN